jgi:predicted aminopeptidase
LKYRDQLDLLYQNDMPPDEKRHHKALIIEALRKEYGHLKRRWQGYSGYDPWFREPINNAKINAVATYHELVPAFQKLIQRTHGDLEQFYQICQNLAEKPKVKRLQELQTETQ